MPRFEPYCTLEQVAIQLGVTRQRVEQIEKEALRKVRAALEAKGYSIEDIEPEPRTTRVRGDYTR